MKIENLIRRAEIIKKIRHFFAERGLIEVETALLRSAPVTDPFIEALSFNDASHAQYFLQTSPEYAMKILLSQGAPSIYQICKAFRKDEVGSLHHIEFTMLEWYRLGFNDHDLMTEVTDLFHIVMKTKGAEKYSYRDLFLKHYQLCPFTTSLLELQKLVQQHYGEIAKLEQDRDTYLQLLLTKLEPHLGRERPCFIYDFPVSQAALARIKQIDGFEVAARFEVYYQGIELGNGYFELTDPIAQEQRFNADLTKRAALGLPAVPIDAALLAALKQGLPSCSGIAIGLDRLIMLALKQETIQAVMALV